MERNYIALCSAAILAFAACAAPPALLPEPAPLDAGVVRREIKPGMDQQAVLQALGPPSRVSTDSQNREAWTWDAIASDRIDTTRSVGGGITVLTAPRGASGIASAANPRALTLIVYYDDQKKVREFAYNYAPETRSEENK
jgi:outer membrane protein assembly factor BamE (lipoprotein component of BamABCDE complex)